MEPIKLAKISYEDYFIFSNYVRKKVFSTYYSDIKKNLPGVLYDQIFKEVARKYPIPDLFTSTKKKHYTIKLSPVQAVGIYLFLSLEISMENFKDAYVYLVMKSFHDQLDKAITNQSVPQQPLIQI